MKFSIILSAILIAGIICISSCSGENKELKKDASNIANAMCKSIEAMKNLRMADPADSLQVHKLQADYESI
jgi:hypothetical protein